MKYTKEEMLSKVDHTLLKPEATWPQIRTLCDEAIANHCASVCINTCYVKQAVEYMAGRVPVCCVVGFPLGAMDTKSKAFEAKTAIENGASEVDMVINIGWLKNKQYDDVRNDIAAVKAAVGGKVLKVKPAAGDQIVEISFEKVGVKKTMANFAPLVKITTEE